VTPSKKSGGRLDRPMIAHRITTKKESLTMEEKEDKIQIIIDSLPELANEIVDLIYKIVFFANSGLE
jgi:hypothetical protein